MNSHLDSDYLDRRRDFLKQLVRQLPDDEQGILRISIGGGKNLPVSVNYCVFRGNKSQCIDLLREALKALETDPKE